ncbi:MAG: hypothetical protein WC565_05075 [Parcubacteria group bacterium]
MEKSEDVATADAEVVVGASVHVDDAPAVTETPGGMEEHRASPVSGTVDIKTIDEMNGKIRSLWRERAWEKESASADAKEHSDEIKRIEGEIDKLCKRVEELDVEERINHERKIVEYVSRSTGQTIRTRPLAAADRQEKLDTTGAIANTPVVVLVKPTFSQLQDGKVWEHDVHGCVRILAVLDGSVRVQTEDLDCPEEGVEIGVADWDANDAHPREVPELDLAQWWVLDQKTVEITAADDVGVCVQRYPVAGGDPEAARYSRLSFCAEGSKLLTLEIGDRYWLDDHTGPVVTVQGAEVDGHCLCELKDGEQEQVEVRRLYLGAKMMPEVEVPKKRAKKNGKAATAEV